MRKLKIVGSYPNLSETARRLGMTPEEITSVQRIASKIIEKHPARVFSVRREALGDEPARTRTDR